MNEADLSALWLTFKLALTTTTLLLLIGMPLAWWLAQTKKRVLKTLVEAAVALPLVLPPTVLGFYLLIALGPQSPLAPIYNVAGLRSLAFTFPGLVIGSMIYSLPFVVRPLQTSFAGIDARLFEAAATLRASGWNRFCTIALPLSRPGIITAAVLGFAHTIGEFGVVLMIGGNIPGKTRVLSIAIYDHVEMIEYGQAHLLAGILLVVSFFILVVVQLLNRQGQGVGA